ncbi:Oidioi.mRNA.OKI2018_I69.chr1.g3272.t1.cds [Oikopleura dioica]|uniref:Oidioi.mRNA.OKI2018_I69.chr1.g3272.t1.cds n=1 Tax=Oikopleura dioica TaxID=34765 RepID=A0ABN7T049_OIKDI|nr:Oidioi.mRNA.OKI2018_I69.chr1.g3272.t1.cds [Oikopleura dioica]
MEVDSGAESSCLSAAYVPDEFLQMLKPCPFKVTGFSPNIPAEQPMGILPCRLSFNGGPAFSLNLTIMPGSKYPSLLGRDILENAMTDSFTVDNKNRTLSFCYNEAFTQTETQVVKLDGVKRTKIKKYLTTRSAVKDSDRSRTQPPPKVPKLDAPNKNAARCPIQLAKQKLGITLPANADPGQKKVVAELCLDFDDRFGCDGQKMGEFPFEIEIPTDGH